MKTPWNNLSHHFDTHRPDADPGVVSNLSQLCTILDPILGATAPAARILDFGCGAGQLCQWLHERGFNVVGFDVAEKMIEVALKTSSKEIKFVSGDTAEISAYAPFDFIVSSMVFQFIPDPEATFSLFKKFLRPGGAFLFSVHHADYVWHKTNSHTRFEDLDQKSGTATLILSDVSVKTYVRTESEYRTFCERVGFRVQKVWKSEPYSDGTPSKFLTILALEKE